MAALPEPLRPERSAHASIRGYLYQAALGVERWVGLAEGEVLLCEGDEDLDRLLLGQGEGLSEQVKDYSSSLDLRHQVVRESLRNFLLSWVALRQRGETRRFRFTTTADLRDPGVLAFWEEEDRREEVAEEVRQRVLQGLSGTGGKRRKKKQEQVRQAVEAALGYLDGEGGRWGAFLGSVSWRFGAPRLAEVREAVTAALRARPETGVLPIEGLFERLLFEVLQASSQKEVAKRVLDRTGLEQILGESRAAIKEWLAGSEGLSFVERLSETEELGRLLVSGALDLGEIDRNRVTPSLLLTAAYEVVPFEGRQEELEDLAAWRGDDKRWDLRRFHGEGGTGKTRLFLEACRQAAAQGWHAGFLKREVESGSLEWLFRGHLPRLVVIDYAETRIELVRRLLGRLGVDGPKIRTVLLTRHPATWLEELSQDDGRLRHLALTLPEPEAVDPLVVDEESRPGAFARAAKAFAGAGAEVRAVPDPLPSPDLCEPLFERALYLHMAALLALSEKPPSSGPEILEEVLAHERRFWKKEARQLGLKRPRDKAFVEGFERLVAAVTLRGGARSREGVEGLLERLEAFGGSGGHGDLRLEAIDLLERLYTSRSGRAEEADGRERWVDPLQPDLLGERLVEEALSGSGGKAVLEASFAKIDTHDAQSALSVLLRIADRDPAKEGWLGAALAGRLEALGLAALRLAIGSERMRSVLHEVVAEGASDEEVIHLAGLMAGRELKDSLPLLELGVELDEKAVKHFRQRTEDDPRTLLVELARHLNNLGYRLGNLGRHGEALEAILQALDLYRKLAHQRPDSFLPNLAMSHNNLGNRLRSLGRHEEALEATLLAVHLYRKLAHERPDSFLPNLATSLNNLGEMLADLGRHNDALQATQNALDIRRKLAYDRPDVFLPDVASSLNNLGKRFDSLGRYDDAFHATQNALDIRRKLADERPDSFVPDLAMNLNNLAVMLSNLGRHDDALEATHQAVGLYRNLAQERPDAFSPGLAMSLNNLGNHLSDLGRRKDALEASQQALDLYRNLAHDRPEAFLPELAKNLNNLGNRLGDLGRHEEALEATQQALDLYRDLAHGRPEAFSPSFAMSLNNLGNRLSDLGRYEDALEAVQKAVDLYRQLTHQHPDAVLRNLATSLDNLGVMLSNLGRYGDALEASQQAVGLYRQLAHEGPNASLPGLATSLNNLGEVLRNLGRSEEAFRSFEEGIRHLSPYFLRHPAAFSRVMTSLIQNHLAEAKKSGQEPDEALLAPLQAALEAHQGHQESDPDGT